MKRIMTCVAGALLALTATAQAPAAAQRPPITPAWALGHIVWEDSLNTTAGAEQLVNGYLSRDIPVDAVIIDSPWSTTYNDFNWDRQRYADPEAMIQGFSQKGVRTILWVTGNVNERCKDTPQQKSETYDEVVSRNFGVNNSQPYEWWKGYGQHIDFTNAEATKWWYGQLDKVFTKGVYGWKTDQGEQHLPKEFDTSKGHMTNEEFRHFYYDAMYDYTVSRKHDGIIIARPFSHQGGLEASVGKMSLGWCGDFTGSFKGLKHQIDNIFRSAQYGYGAIATEVGGFWEDRSEAVELVRYAQFGCMTAAMINGGMNGAFTNHLPWWHSQETEAVYRDCVKLMKQLTPYKFSTLVDAHLHGGSLMKNTNLSEESHQLGNDLFTKAITSDENRVTFHLPADGEWTDYWSGKRYQGGELLTKTYPLHQFPLFVRAGAIIPMYDAAQNRGIVFCIWPEGQSSRTFHLPKGDGTDYYDCTVSYDEATGKAVIDSDFSASFTVQIGNKTATGKGRHIELFFEVSTLPAEAWKESEWLCVADAPEVKGRVNDHTRAADGASWFVTTIVNEQKVTKALWMTVSLGVNELYVNGERIGKEVLRPGFSHHSRTKYSFTYDVTRQFKAKKGGVNMLAAQVTPGWWADKIITPSGSSGMYGQKCAFRGVLEVTFADGSTRRYGTNTKDWKAGIAGPVRHAAIFDGEEYDARQPLGFLSPELLGTPAVSNEYVGIIVPENGAEVYQLSQLALNPQRAYVYSNVEGATARAFGKIVIDREYAVGTTSVNDHVQPWPIIIRPGEHLVVDFGQNCAAVPSFRFKAKEGTRLSCLPAELTNDGNGAKNRGMDGPEGSIHRRNLRIHDKSVRLDYTFASGKGGRTALPVEYTPRCTFFGYRFLDITVSDEVVIEQIRSIPVSSITPEIETGHITTGNDLINQLLSNTLWGMRSNYLSVPTDCPQRNERLGWTADTQVFCETGTFFANTNRFFHKWLRDLRDTQSEQGGYPGVAPAGQYGCGPNEYMRLGWADAGIIVPWTIWKQFGDASIIEESWESMERYMTHISKTKYDHTALSRENGNYQWADWLSYEPLESCGGGAFKDGRPLPEAIEYWNYLGASYWAIDAGMMVDMAKATGRDADEYLAMVSEAKAFLRERFFQADGTFKCSILNTMQTPALFALHNNLFEGEAKARTTERLRENFRQHGDCLQTGFLGTSILMPTLTENGMADVAYTLLFQRKNPSWLYSVDNGATTIWERWNSYTKESGMGPNGMNSFNHYAYGCVCQWIWQTCAGIASATSQPGFKHIIMRPVPDRRLGHLDASYQSAAGLIESHWKYEGDDWIWTFTIPKGATASVTLPGENETKDYQAGTYTLRKTLR